MEPGADTLKNGRRKVVLDALRTGNTKAAAAEAAGIRRETLWRWEQEDATLRNDIARAEAEAEQLMVQALHAAAVGSEGVTRDWRAAESWLKRRRREDWGDALDLRRVDDVQLLRLIEAAATRGGATGADGPVDATDGRPEGPGAV